MQRILVIGSPGAGKSTLASRLAGRLGLPLIHLDREYFGPGWTMPSKDEWRERVKALAARPAWVMDGNYASTFDIRVPRATAIVWLDLPRWQCLAERALAGGARITGGRRPDLGPDCSSVSTGPSCAGSGPIRKRCGPRPSACWSACGPTSASTCCAPAPTSRPWRPTRHTLKEAA